MRAWALMLSGLIVWSLHFAGLYLLASLEDFAGRGPGSRWIGLIFSGACLGGVVVFGWAALRNLRRASGEPLRFMAQIALLGAAIGFIAIAWQTLVLATP